MKDIVTRTEVRYLQRRAGAGQSAQEISHALDINLPRIEAFMPESPEIEKAKATSRATARAATKKREEEIYYGTAKTFVSGTQLMFSGYFNRDVENGRS